MKLSLRRLKNGNELSEKIRIMKSKQQIDSALFGLARETYPDAVDDYLASLSTAEYEIWSSPGLMDTL